MGNTENMENTENVENLEALIANGGEPEDTEEDIARREKALKQSEEYYKLITSGNYYVRLHDPNVQMETEALEETQPAGASARLYTNFVMKALQNGGNISPLSWNSSGDKNTQISGFVWDRMGVSCCASGTPYTPGFVLSYSEHVLDSSDTHGNKNFKAAMVKADYKVIVPAYSKVTLNVTINLHVFKRGGETSASWIGAIISDKDTWTPLISGNSHWADNNGVIKSNNPADCTLAQGNGKKENLRLSLTDYECGTEENDTCDARAKTFTLYIMGSIDKASSINHRLLVFDRIEDTFSARISGECYIDYYADGGAIDGITGNESYTQKICFDSRKQEEVYLCKAEKEGYILGGWKDRETGRIYPAGGLFREWRGMHLTAQWVPNTAEYRVEYFLQNIDGTFPDKPTEYEILTGTVGQKVVPDVKCYDGFRTPLSQSVYIMGDGSTVVTYQYIREKYLLRFVPNGGRFKDNPTVQDYTETKVKYGDKIEYPQVEKRTGYIFSKWSGNYQNMPANDLTIRAEWEADI